MKRAALHHPKSIRLSRELGIPLSQALGILCLLWDATGEYAAPGDIGRFADEDIVRWCDWPEDRAKNLVRALVNAKLLDKDKRHRLVVHDWHEHAEEWIKRKLARADKGFVTQPRLDGVATVSSQCRDDGEPASRPPGLARPNAIAIAPAPASPNAIATPDAPTYATPDAVATPSGGNGDGHAEEGPENGTAEAAHKGETGFRPRPGPDKPGRGGKSIDKEKFKQLLCIELADELHLQGDDLMAQRESLRAVAERCYKMEFGIDGRQQLMMLAREVSGQFGVKKPVALWQCKVDALAHAAATRSWQ